jgi:hypothetical protein
MENVSMDYERAFDILKQSVSMQGVDKEELLDYCKVEILKPKYKEARLCDGFRGLIKELDGGCQAFV